MDKFFKISERGSNVKTEIIAGLTTFFAMAYIIIVNPNQIVGFSFGVPGVDAVWNAVYIATIIASVIGTLLFAFYAKLPFAQSCGMGLNSFFFTSFVLPQVIKIGNGEAGDVVKGYQAGLVIILISGLIFLILSATGAREYIAKAMPDCIKKSIPAGIGLFIAFIGFQNVGIIQANQYTLVQFVKLNGATWYQWDEALQSYVGVAPAVIALLGFIIIAILSKLKVKGAVLIGILATSVIFYLATWTVPSLALGEILTPFKDFADIGITAVFTADSWKNAFSPEMVGGIFSAIMLIVTFCLVDMFDTIGTLYGTASEADMLDENGDPIDVDKAMTCDSVATVSGSILGTSTVTTFVESAAGVAAGGKTGLTSLVTAICFAVCLFLAPFASIIPSAATAPALIFVGVLMLKNFAKVDMTDMRNAVPAFLTLIMMPLTYSIANGIGIGSIAYVLITLFTGKFSKKDIAVTVIALLFVAKFIFGTM
ncbi:MAG: NCS2 family permease [Clostridia bacterium]|nr:NCS2 family permease [Clostridia bacterium]